MRHETFGMFELFVGLAAQFDRQHRLTPQTRQHALRKVLLYRAHFVRQGALQPAQGAGIGACRHNGLSCG